MSMSTKDLKQLFTETENLPVYVYVGFNRYKINKDKIHNVSGEFLLIEVDVDEVDNIPNLQTPEVA